MQFNLLFLVIFSTIAAKIAEATQKTSDESYDVVAYIIDNGIDSQAYSFVFGQTPNKINIIQDAPWKTNVNYIPLNHGTIVADILLNSYIDCTSTNDCERHRKVFGLNSELTPPSLRIVSVPIRPYNGSILSEMTRAFTNATLDCTNLRTKNPHLNCVINMSMIAYIEDEVKTLKPDGLDAAVASLMQAIYHASKTNIAIIVAAGNHGTNACKYLPAIIIQDIKTNNNDGPILVVGGYDAESKNILAFSNYGKCVNTYRAGNKIESLEIRDGDGPLSGTSFAAPVAAGQIAAFLHRLGQTPHKHKMCLLHQAIKKTDPFQPILFSRILTKKSDPYTQTCTNTHLQQSFMALVQKSASCKPGAIS